MPSLFDSIRARIRAQATGGAAPEAPASPTSPSSGDTPSLASSLTSAQYGTGATASTAMGAGTPAVDAEAPQAETGFLSSFNMTTSNPAYAAAKESAPMAPGSVFDVSESGSKMNKTGQSVLAMFDPSPFAGITSLMSGTNVQTPMGTTSFRPTGLLGTAFDINMNNQYDIAAEVAKGTPGYHQFMADGKVVGITPGPLGPVVNGTFNGTSQQAVNQYAAMFGVDPKTADMSARPGEDAFGEALTGFVGFSGGFDSNGDFVDAAGNTDTAGLSVEAMTNHVGLVNDFVGLEAAMNAIDVANMDQSAKDTMMSALQAGELHANAATDKAGNIVGYATATGNVVPGMFDSQGNPVTTGTGIVSPAAVSNWAASQSWAASEYGMDATQSLFGGFDAGTGFGDTSAGTIGEWSAFDTADFGDIGVTGIGTGDTGSSDAGASDGDADAGFSGPFARGGYAMAEGGTPPAVAQPEQTETAGFVDRPPEQVSDAETVADNVPADVEEGTFVLNAPAVEFMGSDDVKKMLIEATDEAERQGIDIVQNNTKMDKKKLLSLVVSKGEVLIPPVLAKIIGYDRLEKINNRGKQEVEKRIAENGQDIPQEPVNKAAEGGEQSFIKKPDQTDEFANIYSSIQKQGGDPRLGFKDFTKTMKAFAKGRIYRPMQAEPNTPEFDAEVKEKYNLFFLDEQKYPYMDESQREAARAMDKANMIDMSLPLAREREDGTIYYVDRQSGKEVPNPNSGEGFVPAP